MKIPSTSYRRGTFERPVEGRRMAAALSSDEPVAQAFGMETLVHTTAAIDMSRAADGLPMLLNHDASGLPIGRVESIRIDGNKLRGDLVFSDATPAAREAFDLVTEGTLSDVSIGYRILDFKRGEGESINVTRWMPVEASVVSVPADATVGVGRSITDSPHEEVPVTEAAENTTGAGTGSETTGTAADIIAAARSRSSAAFSAGQAEANQRLVEIDNLTRTLCRSIPDLAPDLESLAEHVRSDATVTAERYQALALELIGGQGHPLAVAQRDGEAPAPGAVRMPSQPMSAERSPVSRYSPAPTPGNEHRSIITPGGDALQRACRGMELSMLERSGAELDAKETSGNQYRGWSMLDMARDCLELSGVSVRGMSSEQLARAAIAMNKGRAISPGTAQYDTTDFPAVTENVMTKRVHDAFAAAEVTWSMWCSSTEVPDFKQFSIPRLSQIASLPTVAENAAYTDLTRADAKEVATLTKQGGLISYTWEALVNDDQRMFSNTAFDLGEAAARTLDEKAYAVLTTNAAMGDTNPLFDALHNNTGTAALDLASIITTRTAIARQTDDDSNLLGIVLRYIIVPEELRDTADNLAGSEYLPWDSPGSISDGSTAAGTSVGGSQRINTVRGTFTTIATVRLTDVNNWYGAAGRGTVELAFLTGNRSPAILREEGWDTDALHWKVRHPSVAYAVDWRGLYQNVVA